VHFLFFYYPPLFFVVFLSYSHSFLTLRTGTRFFTVPVALKAPFFWPSRVEVTRKYQYDAAEIDTFPPLRLALQKIYCFVPVLRGLMRRDECFLASGCFSSRCKFLPLTSYASSRLLSPATAVFLRFHPCSSPRRPLFTRNEQASFTLLFFFYSLECTQSASMSRLHLSPSPFTFVV